MTNTGSSKSPKPHKFAGLASEICNKLGVMHFLDYFCGDSPVMTALKVSHKMRIQCYDPKVTRFMDAPLAAQMVYCELQADKLEEWDILEMLDEIELLTGAVFFLAVNDSPRPAEWWISKVASQFELQTFQRVDGGFYAILYPFPEKIVLQ